MKALVVGGTGPTGHHIVNGLRKRGYETTILHSGRHEVPEIPDDVEHIHTDAYSGDAVSTALTGRTYDLSIVAYGRLRAIAECLTGQTGRLISIGGAPAYRGYMNAALHEPTGLPVPTREDSPLVEIPEDDEKGYRIVRTERALFDLHPDATHFRYPYVYGPYQLVPREWCIARRALDGRPAIVLPDGGLTLHHYGYAENLAHAILLAVDRPEASRGRIYNCGDEEILTLGQVVETVAAALDHTFEIISMPWALATPARPLITQPWTTHRVLDLTRIKTELGYRDRVPAREALARTARWLAENPPEPGGQEETILQDPFDYEAEDSLIARWRALSQSFEPERFDLEPGYTLSYSGPGGRPRQQPFE